jgi:hypothetical protein
MLKTTERAVLASSLLLGLACVAVAQGLSHGAIERDQLAQTIISYGFLRSTYVDFDQLLASDSAPSIARDMKAMQAALTSLGCDVPTRLAFPHGAFVIPTVPVGVWIGRTAKSSPQEGTLFVTESGAAKGVTVVFSSVAPEETTVFWLAQDYTVGLVYDSFHKGEVRNAPSTTMGAIVAVGVAKSGDLLLREWAEPGSRPRLMGAVGRVFQVNMEHRETVLTRPER